MANSSIRYGMGVTKEIGMVSLDKSLNQSLSVHTIKKDVMALYFTQLQSLLHLPSYIIRCFQQDFKNLGVKKVCVLTDKKVIKLCYQISIVSSY